MHEWHAENTKRVWTCDPDPLYLVGRAGLEPATKGFKFARVSPLLGLSHRPQPNCWGAGRSWDAYRMGSSRPSLCTFPPTGLATCLSAGLAQGCHGLRCRVP